MKKSSWALCAVLAAALGFVGCGKSQAPEAAKPQKLRIGVSVPAVTHGWTGGIVWYVQKAEKEIEAANPDVDVIIAMGEDTTKQVDQIENLTARGIDALVVVCQEPGPITPAVKEAKEKGAYVVIVSNPMSEPVQDVFVNGDNRSLGEEAARAMGKLLGGKGDILIIEGIPNPINTDRVEGFRSILAKEFPEIKILDSQTGMWNAEKSMAVMENFLQKYDHVDGVWAGDDDNILGAIKAYEGSGRSDVKAMVGGGGSKIVIKKVLDDDSIIKATVTYSPKMAYIGVQKALEGLRNGKKPVNDEKELIIRSEIVLKENADKFYEPDAVY